MSEGWFNRNPDAIRSRQRRRSQAPGASDVRADEIDDLEEEQSELWGDELRLQWRDIMFDDADEDAPRSFSSRDERRGLRRDDYPDDDVDDGPRRYGRGSSHDDFATVGNRMEESDADVAAESGQGDEGVRARPDRMHGNREDDVSDAVAADDGRADPDVDDISRYRRSRYVANPKDEDVAFDQERAQAARRRREERLAQRARSSDAERPLVQDRPERMRSSTRVMPSDDVADDMGARRNRRAGDTPTQSPAQRGRYGAGTSRERVPRTDYQPRVDLEAARRARLEMDRMAGHAVPSDTESYWDAGQDSKPRGFRLPFGRKKDKEKKAASRDRRRVKHPVLTVLAILFVIVGAWMLVLDHNMHIDDDDLDMACEGHAWPFKPYYVLITGADAEDEGAQRTDSIMLARVDPLRKRATLVSVPRDTRVDLGGYGQSKINAAYSYGGPALATRTVADFASVGDVDVDIAHFFQVGFDGLADLVDAVGGVTVDVPPNTTVDGVTVPAGVQTLDGEQALIFVRCRKTYANGDFQRAQNQRVLMGALADKVKHSPPWRWPGIITAASKCIKSDAHAWQFFGVLLEVAGTGSDDIYSAQVPSRTKTIGGVSYVITDEEAWTQMMENVDAGKDPEATTTS